MTFIEDIFARLDAAGETVILRELRAGEIFSVSGREFMETVARARSFLASQGLKKGDRVALLAHNEIRWVAMDLAIIAEGLLVVPLYSR